MISKYYSKKQLAVAAGVSRTTFYRWLLIDQRVLNRMGVSPNQRLLPPNAVEYICQRHRIDMTKLP